MNQVWSTPWDNETIDAFIADVEDDPAFGERANIEEVTLHYDVDFEQTDTGNAKAEMKIDILREANKQASTGFLTRRTQDPNLDGGNKVPGAMRMVIGGVGARLSILDSQAVLAAYQETLDGSVLSLSNGSLRRFEVVGDEFFSYGAGGAGFVKDRGWRRLKPFELGVDQQIDFIHTIDRKTQWPLPAVFRIRYILAALIARIT